MPQIEFNALQIEEIILDELKVHPKLEPVDIYKLLYQAMYGPSHIVRDLGQLSMSISSELWQSEQPYYPFYQDIGPVYTRISLSVLKVDSDVKERQTIIDYLSRWIIASCEEEPDDIELLRHSWNLSLPMMKRLMPAESEAWDKVTEMVSHGRITSHSAAFHHYYSPHYRLVRKDLKDYYKYFMELNK